MKVLDCFAGIGGFSCGLERTGGFETVAFCEIEPFCQKVLNKHWPDVPVYSDIRELSRERLESDGISGIDVITGGFPCQDISVAGKQAGITGERSGLWSELARLIGDIRPKYAIMENVTALISGDRGRWFGRVLGDLAEIGYDAEWHCIPASELGANHHRDRVWILAYPKLYTDTSNRIEKGQKDAIQGKRGEKRLARVSAGASPNAQVLADSNNQRLQRGEEAGYSSTIRPRIYEQLARCFDGYQWADWKTEPDVGRVADGIPDRAHRLKALGNAVVPQIPELIGRAILANESHH